MKYLALAQKGTERNKGKGKGREAVIKDVKVEVEILREGVTIEATFLKPPGK